VVVNRSLRELLRCVMGEKQRTRLLLVEFAYNNVVNRSTGKSSFEVFHGYSPCTPVDLILLHLMLENHNLRPHL